MSNAVPIQDPRCPWCRRGESLKEQGDTHRHCVYCDRAYQRVRRVR